MPDTLTTTLADLRAALRVALGAAEGSAAFWTDLSLNAKIRETVRTWNLLTGYWAGRQILATTGGVGQVFIAIPAGLGWTVRMEWLGTPLYPTSLFALDTMEPGWQSASPGTPVYWAPISPKLVAIAPAPLVSDTALAVDGVLETPALASDTAEITFARQLAPVFLAYARHLSLFRLGASTFQQTKAERVLFWKAAGFYNTKLQATSLYRRVLGIYEPEILRGRRRGTPGVGVAPTAPDPEVTSGA